METFYNLTYISLLIHKFKALVCVYGVHCGLWPLLDLPPLNKKIKLTNWGHPKKIWHEAFLDFEKKKWICTQRSKYAQNNPLAVFKIVLRSPLELSGTCGSKILIENIYFNNSKLFFHSTQPEFFFWGLLLFHKIMMALPF